MTGKEAFLDTVRRALRRAGEGGHAPGVEGPSRIPPTLQAWRAEAERVRQRLLAQREGVLLRLQQMAEVMQWRVVRAGSPAGAARAVAAIAREVGARLVVRTAHPVFTRVPVEEALREAGVPCHLLSSDEGDRALLRERAARADLGVTGVEYMVAETATALILARRGVSRLASLTPPRHIALVEPEQVVESLADALALQKARFLEEGDPGGYWSLISGPSRTGDIEQTIVVGAHGPREVYLVALW
jgi:L-lactate dehydrogenase complex protein LldG